MNDTVSKSRTEEIIKCIERGDCRGISLEEFLQVSFLTLMDGVEQHVEQKIMYGGNLFMLHACVEQINPSQPMEALRRVV